jgi:hypothetical protein
MLIFIDREFAIAFEKEMYKRNPFENPDENDVANRLFQLFRKFPELEVYSDATQLDKTQIRLFGYLLNLNAIIRTQEQFIVELKKTEVPLHLLAFTSKRYEWANHFEEIGGLYFTTADYLSKLSDILSYEKSIRFTELKKPFAWNDIAFISNLPANKALITDNYLISSKDKRNKNFKPLLRIFSKINVSNFKLELFVNEDKLSWNKDDWDGFHQETDDFMDDEDLDIDIVIKRYSIRKGNSKYNFHDRKLFLRYLKLEVGKGFDLLPYDSKSINDRKIIIGTIFSKDTYDDFRSYYF